MKQVVALFVASLFAGALFVSCKPKASNELQYWENNKKDFASVTVKYPNFKEILDKNMADATKMWDEALKITKEDDKAAAMKKANEKLTSVMGQLTQIDSKSKSLEDAIAKFNAKKLTKDQDKIRGKAVAEARKALADVAGAIAKAKPASDEDALKAAKEGIDNLISAQGALDRAMKSVEPKKADAPAKKKK